MSECHLPPFIGHRGISATIQTIEKDFYWPRMRKDIAKFIQECDICQRVKYDRGKTQGKMHSLPIPENPWEDIAMDFITGLPITNTKHDSIWTIVDRFSKQAHFIPCKKTQGAPELARLFIKTIFVHHGMPKSIVSDRDPKFTSNFWQALFENIGTQLKFSTSFHPQTDGQSEVTNRTILDLLKSYVNENQRQWETFLPLVEFAYNNTKNTTTGKSPFDIIYTNTPRTPILRTNEKVFAADDFIEDYSTAMQKVKDAIKNAQQKQERYANKHRRHITFQEGQYVLLKFNKKRLKTSSKIKVKLSHRYFGPFRIIKKISDVVYKLELPADWRIHNVFHIDVLKLYQGQIPTTIPQQNLPDIIDSEEIIEPESILMHKHRELRGRNITKYLLKFKNYPPTEATWVDESFFKDFPKILEAYHRSQD
jgi:hypothetical protein